MNVQHLFDSPYATLSRGILHSEERPRWERRRDPLKNAAHCLRREMFGVFGRGNDAIYKSVEEETSTKKKI